MRLEFPTTNILHLCIVFICLKTKNQPKISGQERKNGELTQDFHPRGKKMDLETMSTPEARTSLVGTQGRSVVPSTMPNTLAARRPLSEALAKLLRVTSHGLFPLPLFPQS